MSDAMRVVHYISSEQFVGVCDKHPKIKLRASLLDHLLGAYDLKQEMTVVSPLAATTQDLLTFHTEEYVACLKDVDKYFKENETYCCRRNSSVDSVTDVSFDVSSIEEESNSDITSHGFGYDCELFPEILDYVKFVAGATLTGAELLVTGESSLVVNFNGGWHHAHIDEVAGFCYVNDIVIGILRLMKKFKRVLYIDLDIHHGDGVEEAFKYSKKVMTFSIHKYVHGYFPGTGSIEDVGAGGGQYYSVNIPLKDGIRDAPFHNIFNQVFSSILRTFDPDVIVCQCGADMLSGDPLGGFNLTGKAVRDCLKNVYDTNIPLMVLGGGGYHLPNTARCWTELISMLVNKELDDNIPEHDYLEKYGPDFCLNISRSNRKDENTEEYLACLCEEVCNNLQGICLDSAVVELPNKENHSTTYDDSKSTAAIDDLKVLKDVGNYEENETIDVATTTTTTTAATPLTTLPTKRKLTNDSPVENCLKREKVD